MPVNLSNHGKLKALDADVEANAEYAISAISYIPDASRCASAYSDDFNFWVVDEQNGKSEEKQVNIKATITNCAPKVSSTLNQGITSGSTIDFSTYISDDSTSVANLKITLESLADKGVLKTSEGDALTNIPYAVDALTYTSDDTKCAGPYVAKFVYSITDTSGLSNTNNSATLNVSSKNCAPKSEDFNQEVTNRNTVNFVANINDTDDSSGDLHIILTSLPTKGVLWKKGEENTIAVINMEYYTSQLLYISNVSECKERYEDSFKY